MFDKTLVSFADKIAYQRHLIAVRRGLSFNLPLIVIGSFAIVLNNFPLAWYQEMMRSVFGPSWLTLGQAVSNGSFAVISILLVLSISYFLAQSHPLINSGVTHPLTASLVSFSCLMVIMQPVIIDSSTGIPTRWTGTHGLFLAIATALIATELFMRLCTIKKAKIVIFSDEADPTISQTMACIVPAVCTVAAFAIVKFLAAAAGIHDIHRHIYLVFESLFKYSQSELEVAIAFIGLVHSFWFFGLHGNNILEPVAQNLYVAADNVNMAVYAAGGQPPEIFTKTFFDIFVLLGGSGSTLSLIIALLIVTRRSNMIRLATLSFPPAIFNVNELLLFGLPIVLNPIYLIPFLSVPLTLTIVSYLALKSGIVTMTIATIPWTTPPLISGYIATGSLSGTMLQAFNIMLGTAIYLPFVRFAEKQKAEETKQALVELTQQVISVKPVYENQFLNKNDSVGNLARVLAHDLEAALKNNKLVLEYQPQVNSAGIVFGLEALLRWPHAVYGRIPPQVVVSVAEEAGMIHQLGKWVIDEACRQINVWKQSGITQIRVSVNVSAMQINEGLLPDEILAAIKNNGLAPGELEIEITENAALSCGAVTIDILEQIYNMGVRIAIDDFGQGYSSLQYIKSFPIDTLKIDRTLSCDVLHDKGSQEIISSITALCNSLNIDTVVEYVETIPQFDKLRQLACMGFQGYLFSPSLPAEKVPEFIEQQSSAAMTASTAVSL